MAKDSTIVRSSLNEKGHIRVVSNHPLYNYEYIYGCQPKVEKDCESCVFRYKCYTGEEVQVFFNGNTLGIFPKFWETPNPSENELEAYLWGKSNGRLQIRTIL